MVFGDILDKGLPISTILYIAGILYIVGMISRASFGIVSSIGALLLLAIWPNILPLQQHLAMAQIVPGAARVPPSGPPSGPAPANSTTTAPANSTTAGGAPDPGDPAGEEVVPHWFGGAPCHDEIESNCSK